MPFGIRKKPEARLLDGAAMTDACQHILQCPSLGDMVVDIIGRHERDTDVLGERDMLGQPSIVFLLVQTTRCKG